MIDGYHYFTIEDQLGFLEKPTGVAVYDFAFEQFFNCAHPLRPAGLPTVARVGAPHDYAQWYSELQELGISLIHSPAEQLRCTTLSEWYPLIEELTPRSQVFGESPSVEMIEANFDYPLFMKGSRQTNRHQASLSIIRDRSQLKSALAIYRSDPVLHWQEVVCRELMSLRPIEGGIEGKVPASFEFRTFWWYGEFVGAGAYWFEADTYQWNETERAEALEVAHEAARQIRCPFVAIDVAQCQDGRWIVIECNDGQESGFAGASPAALWQNVLALCKQEKSSTLSTE